MQTTKVRSGPFRRANDTDAMREAINKLEAYKGLRRTSQYQLKINEVNFYPDTGTVQIDQLPKQREKGICEFLRLLESRNLLCKR